MLTGFEIFTIKLSSKFLTVNNKDFTSLQTCCYITHTRLTAFCLGLTG